MIKLWKNKQKANYYVVWVHSLHSHKILLFFIRMKQNTKYRIFYTCAMCNWPCSRTSPFCLSLRKKKKKKIRLTQIHIVESPAIFGLRPWKLNIFFFEVFFISLLSFRLDALLRRILIHNLSHSNVNFTCFYLEYLWILHYYYYYGIERKKIKEKKKNRDNIIANIKPKFIEMKWMKQKNMWIMLTTFRHPLKY